MEYRIKKIAKNGTTMFFPQVKINGVGWFGFSSEWRGITKDAETCGSPLYYYAGFDFSIREGALNLINEHHKKLYPVSELEYEYIKK